MDDIAVIIVNWNGAVDLRHCLTSLLVEPTPGLEKSIWVVDNASSDDSVRIVENEFPIVHLIRSGTNSGFSRANNLAIQESTDSRYVLLLNSDAFIRKPADLSALVAFADQHPALAVAGTKVLNVDGSLQFSCRRFPGLRAGLFRNTFLGRLFPHNPYTTLYLMGDVDHTIARQVDWVSGCSMLLRREFLREHGALDERFFMYCEDVDICRRAWDNACQVWYCPDAVVTHKIGASSDKNAEKMIWEFHRSWEMYDEKHHPRSSVLRRLAVKGGLWLRATIRIRNRRTALRKNTPPPK